MASDAATKAIDVLYVILGLLPFILLCIRRMCTSWDRKNDQVYEALRSPSVRDARNAFDRRVALAIREAKQDTRLCAGCGFSNALCAAACVLCGTVAPRTRKRLFRSKASPATAEDAAPVAVTARQWRVRRRKEWARRVDADGHVAWVHDATLCDPRLAEFPAYVLKTTRQTPPVGTQEVEDAQAARPLSPAQDERRVAVREEATRDSQISIVVDGADEVEPELIPMEPEPTIADVAHALTQDLSLYAVEVVQTDDADAAATAFTTDAAVPQAAADTVRNAQLAFPTKLAQFITSTASLFNEANRTSDTNERIVSRVSLHRESLLADSMAAIATMAAKQAGASIRVAFIDEQGVDAGGVYREWFLLLNEQIVKPDAGVFTCVDEHDQTYYLNPHSRQILGEHHLAHFLSVGRLLGRALLQGYVTGFHLATPLLKIILGLPVGFSDLEYFDPEAYKNLVWLLENDGVDMLGLDFTVVEKLPNGQVAVVEVVAGGSEMDVTDANKLYFVDRKLKYLLFGSVQLQLAALLKGLYEVVPAELLMLFDASELDYILSGSDEIDVDDWEAHTTTSKNIALHPAFSNFWKVVRELSAEEQRRLLQFATGSTRLPPGGFSALTSHDGRLCLFSLNGVFAETTWGSIHAHACFNKLDVPLFWPIEPLREAVKAVVANESVGFTTI